MINYNILPSYDLTLCEDISLVPEVIGQKKYWYITGIFMQANVINRNNRIYPKEILDRAVNDYISEYVTQHRAVGELSHPNSSTLGRVAIVTRIRNGKVQLNKKVDIMGSGFKLTPSGLVVKMSPQEVMVRKQAARRGARKRQVEMQSIIRKRMLSMRIRNTKIGRAHV